jgi:hypothetical protein
MELTVGRNGYAALPFVGAEIVRAFLILRGVILENEIKTERVISQ